MRATALLCAAATLVVVAGCKSDKVAETTNPKAALAGSDLTVSEKSKLVDRVAESAATPGARREALKDIAWTASNGGAARNRAIDLLVDDPTDPDNKDTRQMLVLLMGPEPDWGVVDHVCKIAGERGWTDLTPVIVRQLAKVRINTDDRKRVEWATLEKLHPGEPVEEVAFEVFAVPEATGSAKDRTERAREAAWQLLTRLDKDGSKRRAYLASMASNPAPAMADVRAVAADLGAVPLTASELQWVRQLRRPENSAWWEAAKGAIGQLPDAARQGFAIRDAEAVRWASVYEPAWLKMSRDELAAAFGAAIKGREIFQRAEGSSNGGTERFQDNLKKMAWGDVLSLLVLDRAVRSPGIAERLVAQAAEDAADVTTEYGGYIGERKPADARGSCSAYLFPPRPQQRINDTRFVASDELLTAGATGLAVYHFHAQKFANSQYAGPSEGDIDYARDSGRLCVVFTPVARGVFDVDAYFGDGVRCDLGTIGPGDEPSGSPR